MQSGCISLGEVKCSNCDRIIPSSERYLAIDAQDTGEVGRGRTLRYCVDCCLKKGYAHYRVEKGEQILTFFEEISIVASGSVETAIPENLPE